MSAARRALAIAGLVLAGGMPAVAQRAPLRVDVSLTVGALRLTRAEGGGEYLRERVVTGAGNAVAKAAGVPRERGDLRPEDDVYLLVLGRESDGEPFARIVPAPDGALWRVHKVTGGDDGDGALTDAPLWDGSLSEGKAVDLTIAVLEYDGDAAGGRLAGGDATGEAIAERLDAVRAAGLALATRAARGDTLAVRPGAVRAALAAALGAGVDDVVGAMRVELRAVGGTPVATWRALDDARDKGHTRLTRGHPLRPRWLRLEGDGARYEAHVRVSAR